MDLLNQPRDAKIGEKLQLLLKEGGFTTFYVMAAYVKESGVKRLKPFIEHFRRNGGIVKAVVGVDQKNTSRQGLAMLRGLCDEISVFHSESWTQTFHPKAYALEKEGEKASLFVGSSNLTSGGLYTNYELNSNRAYNLADAAQLAEFERFKTSFRSYATHPTCSKVLTEGMLEQLIAGDYLSDEEVERRRLLSTGAVPSRREQPIFGREVFHPPAVEIIREAAQSDSEVSGAQALPRGGFWKKLSNYDVSETSSPGQMQIQKDALDLFPPFTEWTTGSHGSMQSENFFDVVFISSRGERTRVNNARAILYVPAPTHARPNNELRFTFRTPTIRSQLNADDVLEFRLSDDPNIRFIIRHIKPDMPEYSNYVGRRGMI